MTEPESEDRPAAGETDLDAAEEYAERAPLDPSPDEVNHYLNLVHDPAAAPEK